MDFILDSSLTNWVANLNNLTAAGNLRIWITIIFWSYGIFRHHKYLKSGKYVYLTVKVLQFVASFAGLEKLSVVSIK